MSRINLDHLWYLYFSVRLLARDVCPVGELVAELVDGGEVVADLLFFPGQRVIKLFERSFQRLGALREDLKMPLDGISRGKLLSRRFLGEGGFAGFRLAN